MAQISAPCPNQNRKLAITVFCTDKKVSCSYNLSKRLFDYNVANSNIDIYYDTFMIPGIALPSFRICSPRCKAASIVW